MSNAFRTILYPITDTAATKALFTPLLGVEPHSDAAYYIGYQVDGMEIGLVPNGDKQGMTGPTPYVHVADVKATYQALLAGGAESVQEPRDVGGGHLVALVKDQDGNAIGLREQA